MYTQKTLLAAAIALLPAGAFAGEFSASAGFEGTIDFDNDFNTTGDEIELFLGGEYEHGGFSAALVMTWNSDDAEAGADELELELELAYGGKISDKTSYEVAATATWLNDSKYDTTELEFGLAHEFTDNVEGSYTYTYDVEAEDDEHEIAVEVGLGDWTVEPVLGTDGDVTWYELNFGYEFESGVELAVEFSDDDSAGSEIETAIVLGYEFDLLK